MCFAAPVNVRRIVRQRRFPHRYSCRLRGGCQKDQVRCLGFPITCRVARRPKFITAPLPELATSKIQRWIDLLAALLVRRYPATFTELAPDVPAYSAPGRSLPTLMRMFERDKDELRALGVPIETLEDEEGERAAYRLSHRNFYLPYLAIAGPDHRAATPARRLDRFGYGALTTLLFEPDELSAVSSAAARVRALGDPLLAADAESAVRKLAIDLPVGDDSPDDIILRTRGAGVEEKVFAVVSDALTRRKILHFEYYAMGPDRTELRSVEPYGLFFLGANWYLVGRDATRRELRNFRLSRITAPRVNPDRAHTADYDLPSDFRLREHAHSRQAWELGTGDHVEAIVRFTGRSGAAAAASRLGSEVPGARDKRAFRVRRIDAFARWLLSFAGDAEPLSPPTVIEAYREQIIQTLAVYETTEGTARSLDAGGSA